MDDKEAMDFMTSCKFFMVFFKLDEEVGRLSIFHYVGFQERPSGTYCQEVIDEIYNDKDMHLCGETDDYRKAIVELAEPVDDIDELTESIACQLLDDMDLMG